MPCQPGRYTLVYCSQHHEDNSCLKTFLHGNNKKVVIIHVYILFGIALEYIQLNNNDRKEGVDQHQTCGCCEQNIDL